MEQQMEQQVARSKKESPRMSQPEIKETKISDKILRMEPATLLINPPKFPAIKVVLDPR
jgi:hypothetical protein